MTRPKRPTSLASSFQPPRNRISKVRHDSIGSAVGWVESSEPTFCCHRWGPKTPPTLQCTFNQALKSMFSRMDLSGARIIVTGASSGIGKALALQLAREKARLMLASRNQDKLEEL